MKAGEIVFQRLLDGKVQYVVPLYQRTYNWEEKQWEQLWDDLLEVYALSEPRNHFIGSIVTQQIPASPESVSRYTLIDGQQRMTTLLILLSVIQQRSTGKEAESDLAEEIGETCLINKFVSGDGKNKLMPTQGDRDAFATVIAGDTPQAGSQIAKARIYFDKMLSAGDEDDNEIDLRKLHSRIVNNLDMVSIHLEPVDSPNRIFESLNNTGMPLSVADLIRNYLLMNIPELAQQEKAYFELWYPMEKALGSNAADFFWQFLMMDGSRPRKDETYEYIQKRVSPATAEDSLAALEKFAKFTIYYVQVAELNTSGLNEFLREPVSRLNRWEVTVAYPFLMRAMDNVAIGNIGPNELVKVVQLIESYVIRRTVCGVPTNQLRRIFTLMSAQVAFNSEFYYSSVEHLLRNRWPGDDEFRSKFAEFPFYTQARIDRTNMVLWTLERAFGHKESPESSDNITIEHIMPQALTQEWREELGESASEIHDRWLHTIGNLTLSGYNPSLGNRPFVEKKNAFAESNFALSASIKNFVSWTETSIKSRGSELAEKALKIWERPN